MARNEIAKDLKSCVLLFATICVLSIVYSYFITFGTQILVPYQASGSLLYVNGTVVGSELIGQNFTSPGYFHGRPSFVGYNGSSSGGSNYGPTSAMLKNQTMARIERLRLENGLSPNASVPADMVLNSGSGLDPHISVEGAMLQVKRVASMRGLPESEVRSLVNHHIEPPQFGFLGQTRINVLKLNIALDELSKENKI